MNQKLYWTDRCLSGIEVYDPTTEYRRTLFNSTVGVRNPHGIVVDPTSGYGKLIITLPNGYLAITECSAFLSTMCNTSY